MASEQFGRQLDAHTRCVKQSARKQRRKSEDLHARTPAVHASSSESASEDWTRRGRFRGWQAVDPRKAAKISRAPEVRSAGICTYNRYRESEDIEEETEESQRSQDTAKQRIDEQSIIKDEEKDCVEEESARRNDEEDEDREEDGGIRMYGTSGGQKREVTGNDTKPETSGSQRR